MKEEKGERERRGRGTDASAMMLLPIPPRPSTIQFRRAPVALLKRKGKGGGGREKWYRCNGDRPGSVLSYLVDVHMLLKLTRGRRRKKGGGPPGVSVPESAVFFWYFSGCELCKRPFSAARGGKEGQKEGKQTRDFDGEARMFDDFVLVSSLLLYRPSADMAQCPA